MTVLRLTNSLRPAWTHMCETCRHRDSSFFFLFFILVFTPSPENSHSFNYFLHHQSSIQYCSQTLGRSFGCDQIMSKILFPVRSTLVNSHRAILSSVVGDHVRNYGVAIFLVFCFFFELFLVEQHDEIISAFLAIILRAHCGLHRSVLFACIYPQLKAYYHSVFYSFR